MTDQKQTQTPGPWKWVEDRMNGGFAGLIGPNGEEVLFPECRNEGDEGETWFEPGESMSEADARLIEAAPDLLEALRMVRNMIGPFWPWPYEQMKSAALSSDKVTMIEEAIAKAEGGSDD